MFRRCLRSSQLRASTRPRASLGGARCARQTRSLEALEARVVLDANNFTSVALFMNLTDPSGTQNVSSYVPTTTSDVQTWLREGTSLTTSNFIDNYWSSLSYGRFHVRVDAVRDSGGNIVVPTINAVGNNAADWGGLATTLVRLNPDRIWQMSGSWLKDGVRVIPSLVLVHRFTLGAAAESTVEWSYAFSDSGNNYRVDNLCHIQYNTALNAATSLPATWGTLAHEYSHDFLNGRDLYGGGGGKVGYWDILGDASAPGHMSDTSSLYKTRLGWINYKQVINGPVRANTQMRLRPYATTGDAIKVVPDPALNPNEYFLLEYRTDTGSGAWTPDGDLRESGLLITHVNERMGDGQHQSYDSPWIDVEEADGNDGRSWPNDRAFSDMPWFNAPGDHPQQPGESVYWGNNWPGPRAPGTLFPFAGNRDFTADSNPSSRFYGGRDSGLRVTQIRESGGEIIFNLELAGNDQSTTSISATDQVLAGDIDGDGRDEIITFDGDRLAVVQKRQNQYLTTWRASDWLDGWNLGTLDRLTVADFNGDAKSDLFLQSPTGWAGLFLSNGQGFTQVWSSGDPQANQNWVGNWHFGEKDVAVAGDFDGDGAADLVLTNSGWATLLHSTGEGFTQAWMSGAPKLNENWIGGWHLGAQDRMYAGDFNGDGRTDLFAANSGWAAILTSNGVGFDQAWLSGDPAANANWIGGWHLSSTDRYYVGDFDGNHVADVFVRSDGWAAMLLSYGTGFSNVWMTGDPSQNLNWIDGWHLGPLDRHLIGDLNGDGRDDVFIRNGEWAANLISDGSSLSQQWIYGGLGLTNSYREVIGQFNYDRRGDVFLYDGIQTKELVNVRNTTNGNAEMWWGWNGSAKLTTMSPPERPESHYSGDFDGDGLTDVVATDGTHLALYLSDGSELRRVWRSDDWVGGWHLGPGDRVLVGDFTGDGKDDLFLRSAHWAGLLESTGDGFYNSWGVGDWLGDWHLGALDRELVGDFNGDGKSDLLIRSPQWVGRLQSNGTALQNTWLVNDWVGGWHLGAYDRMYVGDFNGDRRSEVFVRSNSWAGLWQPTASGLNTVWMTGDPAAGGDWIDGWHLGALDRHVVGDFNMDGVDDLYTRSDQWAAVMLSKGGNLTTEFIQEGRNGSWVYNALDIDHSGHYSRRFGSDIFVTHPGGWAAMLTPTVSSPLTMDVTQAYFREVDSDPLPVLSISDANDNEGNTSERSMVFTLTLSYASPVTTRVAFDTVADTARADSDYVTTSGIVAFAPGETSKTITISVISDLDVESNEIFHVRLKNVVNAALPSPWAVGTIRNDDGLLTVGDINHDFFVDRFDIDLLYLAIATKKTDLTMDLNSDLIVDQGDVDKLVLGILNTSYGDANLDGIFNSEDFVLIFQAGQYEDDKPQNSQWLTGDWDGDQDFTTNDLIWAFTQGGYQA